eukprot:9503864-Pyramimonas_sp.AAC.1
MARAAYMYAASLELIQAAAKRIAPYAKVTPVWCAPDRGHAVGGIPRQVLTCSTLDELAARKLHFKCEVFQKGYVFYVGFVTRQLTYYITCYAQHMTRVRIPLKRVPALAVLKSKP